MSQLPFRKEWLQSAVPLHGLDAVVNAPVPSLECYGARRVPSPVLLRIADWLEFRANPEMGYELWWFRNPDVDWERGLGLAGFALILRDEVLLKMVTLKN